jgi:hypothetical protein
MSLMYKEKVYYVTNLIVHIKNIPGCYFTIRIQSNGNLLNHFDDLRIVR